VSKDRTFANGRAKDGGPYSVGALAHFLKNRFYIGEVVYRAETHAGEHASVIAKLSRPYLHQTPGHDRCASMTAPPS
jgi:hypothetical protein